MPNKTDTCQVDATPSIASEVPLLLRNDRITPLQPDRDFWTSVKTDPRFSDGSLVSIFDYERTWTKRERHPDGDELVLALDGTATIVVQNIAGDIRRVELERGHWFVIPRREWHWLETTGPTRLLFITPHPARTEEQPLSPDSQDPAPRTDD